jgi:RND superfamily putative drug exporter
MPSVVKAFANKRLAWLAVGLWLGVAVVLSLVAPKLADVGTTDPERFLPRDVPSARAQRVLERGWPDEALQEAGIIVLERDGKLSSADLAYLSRFEVWMRTQVPEVRSVQSVGSDPRLAAFLRSSDGGAVLSIVSFATPPFSTPTNKAVDRIAAELDRAPPPDGARIFITGAAAIAADQAEAIHSSFGRTAIVTLVLILLILLYVYRSPVAALIPLFTIGVAFVIARGIVGLIADAGLEISSQVETFMVVMVFGAGTDYVLFLLSRYREERRRGGDDALPRTVRLVGEVVIASGATVVLAFLVQLTARFGIYRSMGPAIGIAVAVTVGAAISLTPAVAALLGRATFWPAHPENEAPDTGDPRWRRIAEAVTRRPAVVLGAGVLLLAIPSVFAVQLRTTFNILEELPEGSRSREGFAALSKHYPAGRLSPVFLVVRREQGLSDTASFDLMRRINQRVGALEGVAEARSAPLPAGKPITLDLLGEVGSLGIDADATPTDRQALDKIASLVSTSQGLVITPALLREVPALKQMLGFFFSKDGTLARIVVSLDADPFSTGAIARLKTIEDAARIEAKGSGVEILAAGPTAFYGDMRRIGTEDFRVMILQVALIVLLVLGLLLRSVVAPFYLLATVLLSFAATMGATVLVFQVLGASDGISLWVPPFLFVMLVALGADYNIFLMGRIKEDYGRTGDVRAAVRQGVEHTGRVITSAGLILAGTFGVLVFAPMPNLKQIGFAIGFGIILDTFVVRTLLVPSATVLLGERVWWPRRLPSHPFVDELRVKAAPTRPLPEPSTDGAKPSGKRKSAASNGSRRASATKTTRTKPQGKSTKERPAAKKPRPRR